MRWIHQGKDITFMVDAVEQVDFLKRLAEEEDVAAALCMDLNVSQQYPSLYFGTRRSALTNAKDTARFIDAILPSPYIYVVGLMGYDAQIAGVGDRPVNKATGTVIRRLQQRAKKEVQKRRQKVVRYIEKKTRTAALCKWWWNGEYGVYRNLSRSERGNNWFRFIPARTL